jgi:hypothetical protein
MLADHAATVFRTLRTRDRSLYQTQMLAFRVIRDAIEIAGPSTMIGGAVQMATVSPESVTLHDWDDGPVGDAVTAWTELEADRFLDHSPP